jgi:hypothetical protein
MFRKGNFMSRTARCCSLAIALFFCVSASGQSTAEINGLVQDVTGGVIAGASVSLQNDATGVKRVTQSNAAGIYAFPLLQPGTYTIVAENAGMEKPPAPESRWTSRKP